MQGNASLQTQPQETEPYKQAAFDEFVTYCALGGLVVEEDVDGNPKPNRLPLYKFCERVGIDQATTWRWKRAPGFAEKVRERREEIVPLARESMAWNQLFLLGMQTQDKRAAVDALKTYLGHFSNLRLPTVKQEVKVEHTLADVFTNADKIIEGEVVNGPAGSIQGSPTPTDIS